MVSPRFGRPLLAVMVAAALAACGQVTGGDPNVAATVKGVEIPNSTVEERFQQAKGQPQVEQQLQSDTDGAFKSQVQAQLLSQLILAEILEQWAEELGVEVSEDDLQSERENLVQQIGGQEAFDSAVEQAGLSPEDVDEQLRQQVLQTKIAEEVGGGGEVTDADVKAFYDENKDTRFGQRAQARHILVEKRAEAVDVKRQLDSGADFAQLARQQSADTGSASNGGDLGEVARGQMVPEFEQAVFDAKVGDVVGPVETQFGFHVIEVTGKTPGQSLAQARDEIRGELSQGQQGEQLQAALTKRTEEAEVEVNPRFGTWDGAAGEVKPEEPLGDTQESTEGAPQGGSEPAVVPGEQATE
ncbi:MAG: peptidylprolyl isomerase [Egibacteraceae bacterium]